MRPTGARRVSNPKLNLVCAQWCEHAKECLGYDPREGAGTKGGESALVDRLVAAMTAEFGDDQKRITHALQRPKGNEKADRTEVHPSDIGYCL